MAEVASPEKDLAPLYNVLSYTDPNFIDPETGRTPLMTAIALSDAPRVSALLASKADPDARDANGVRAIHYAAGEPDPAILRTLILTFKGGPVGIGTLATSVSEDAGTLEEVYEPFLIKEGFIIRTQRGRVATELAYSHLGMEAYLNQRKYNPDEKEVLYSRDSKFIVKEIDFLNDTYHILLEEINE